MFARACLPYHETVTTATPQSTRSIYLQPKHNRVVKTGGASPSIDTCIERALTRLQAPSFQNTINPVVPQASSSSRPSSLPLLVLRASTSFAGSLQYLVAVSCFASLFVLLQKIPLNNYPYLLASTTVIPPHHRHPLSVPLGRTGVNRVELCSPVIEAPPYSLSLSPVEKTSSSSPARATPRLLIFTSRVESIPPRLNFRSPHTTANHKPAVTAAQATTTVARFKLRSSAHSVPPGLVPAPPHPAAPDLHLRRKKSQAAEVQTQRHVRTGPGPRPRPA
ncbi:hypothetical protein Landi51_07079 [Colletotrichum acutatum]